MNCVQKARLIYFRNLTLNKKSFFKKLSFMMNIEIANLDQEGENIRKKFKDKEITNTILRILQVNKNN